MIKLVIFLSAFLLFAIQPLIAKFILPTFGGTYSVWTMVVFFFTSMLLVGYWYASFIISWPKWWAKGIHLGLLLLAILSLLLVWMQTGTPLLQADVGGLIASPALAVVGLLVSVIGCTTLVLASTSVIAQRMYTNLTGKEPYPLYALSNLGSLLGLLTYPFVFELWLPLSVQATWWATLFMVVSLLLAYLVIAVSPVQSVQLSEVGKRSVARVLDAITDHPFRFIFLAALPTFFLASATEYLSKGVASFPLLWVLPLSAYLLSFVFAFYHRRPILPPAISVLLVPALVPVLFLMLNSSLTTLLYWVLVVLLTLSMFLVGSYFHSYIYDRRPEPEQMGKFYVLLTIGGALGSGVVGLLLPVILNSSHELLWLVSLLVFYALFTARQIFLMENSNLVKRFSYYGMMLLFLTVPLLIQYGPQKVIETRNFYGTLSVYDATVSVGSSSVPVRRLLNGSIIHGLQPFTTSSTLQKASYYTDKSGVGIAIKAAGNEGALPEVLVVGAGIGLVSAFCDEVSTLDYIEINPAVIEIAKNYFTYLESCSHKGSVFIADGRLFLEQKNTSEEYDIIAIDAFTDDAIPVHLLTREAFQDAYVPNLRDGGTLAVHISNRYLNLVPPLAGVAKELDLRIYVVSRPYDDLAPHEHSSIWVLLTKQEKEVFDQFGDVKEYDGESYVWTDEQSSILEALSMNGSWVE